MRLLLILLLASFASSAQTSFAVVELFTSEGCSSCPPADELLSKVRKDADKNGQQIFTLSFHVDYWNRLGWKDPFSKYQFTMRQENYSRVLSIKEMFTPEVVINGTNCFTGSKSEKMNEGVKSALATKQETEIAISKDSVKNDTLYISYSIPKGSVDYTIRFALTEDGLSSNVNNGENTGKTLHHDGVVRSFVSVDKPNAKGTIAIPANVFSGKGKRKLIAFVQHKQTMRIVAATGLVL